MPISHGHELSLTEFKIFFLKKSLQKIMPQLELFPQRTGLSKVNIYRYRCLRVIHFLTRFLDQTFLSLP